MRVTLSEGAWNRPEASNPADSGPHPRGFLIHQVQGQTENCIPGLASGALCCSPQRLSWRSWTAHPQAQGLSGLPWAMPSSSCYGWWCKPWTPLLLFICLLWGWGTMVDERDYIHSSWHCIEFGEKRSKRTLGGEEREPNNRCQNRKSLNAIQAPCWLPCFPSFPWRGGEQGLGPDDRL